MAEQKGKFHEYGTPKFDPYYTTVAARQKAAQDLKLIRKRLRSGGSYDWGRDDPVVAGAAYTSRMRTHFSAPPRTRPVPKAPTSRGTYASGRDATKQALERNKLRAKRKKSASSYRHKPIIGIG